MGSGLTSECPGPRDGRSVGGKRARVGRGVHDYLGHGDAFDRALDSFAEAYGEHNERDYDALAGAAASGRIDAETGL
jgi:hypothetical protein